MKLDAKAHLVRSTLIEKGLERSWQAPTIAKTQQIDQIADHFTAILTLLGLDSNHEELKKTPKRLGTFYSSLFWGLDYHAFPQISLMENTMQLREAIELDQIAFASTCEHHFVPIEGTIKIAYVPQKKVIGLSKLIEIVEFFAARPQLQERLTQQLLIALQIILETQSVAILIQAQHYCAKLDQNPQAQKSQTIFKTSTFGGCFKTDLTMKSLFLK